MCSRRLAGAGRVAGMRRAWRVSGCRCGASGGAHRSRLLPGVAWRLPSRVRCGRSRSYLVRGRRSLGRGEALARGRGSGACSLSGACMRGSPGGRVRRCGAHSSGAHSRLLRMESTCGGGAAGAGRRCGARVAVWVAGRCGGCGGRRTGGRGRVASEGVEEEERCLEAQPGDRDQRRAHEHQPACEEEVVVGSAARQGCEGDGVGGGGGGCGAGVRSAAAAPAVPHLTSAKK